MYVSMTHGLMVKDIHQENTLQVTSVRLENFIKHVKKNLFFFSNLPFCTVSHEKNWPQLASVHEPITRVK